MLKKAISKISIHTILILTSLLSVFPFIWLTSTSLKGINEDILREALYEFPILEVKVNMPEWISILNSKNDNLTNNSYITEEINSCISFPNESTGVPQLTVPQIRDIVIVLPSKEEQTAIANVLSSMDKEIETLNTKLEKYRNLKTAMMQQLFTGKIRLG